MMDDARVDGWLTDEIVDHLEIGPIGLYELPWLLNGSEFGLTEAEGRQVSRRVALRLLEERIGRLFVVSWPNYEILDGPLDAGVLNEYSVWGEKPDGSFIALIAAEHDC